MSLSVVILAKNEEESMKSCIKSVSFADEIVVIDDESIDQTVQIAEKSGARVIVNKLKDFASQRNFALTQTHGDWILFLDADERVTPQLAREITSVVE